MSMTATAIPFARLFRAEFRKTHLGRSPPGDRNHSHHSPRHPLKNRKRNQLPINHFPSNVICLTIRARKCQ
jgi:hypothetical protein